MVGAGIRGAVRYNESRHCVCLGGTVKKNQYTVSDGKFVLLLAEAPEGGYVVTSPLEPELITEAESITEAFANARDALKALHDSKA